MIFRESGSELIETDTRGRTHTPPERRQQLLAEFDRNGLRAPNLGRLDWDKVSDFGGLAAATLTARSFQSEDMPS